MTRHLIFLKPDALQGRHALIDGSQASDFILGLAHECDGCGTSGLSRDGRRRLTLAFRHVTERARTEAVFSSGIIGGRPESVRLRKIVLRQDKSIRTRALLKISLRGLGFSIERAVTHKCNAADVDAIYAPSTISYATLRPQLIRYLAEGNIEILQLRSRRHATNLHHWKTYARHLLKDRPRTGYLLKNLVHVCEEADLAYVASVLRTSA